jgi:hypothetical protein
MSPLQKTKRANVGSLLVLSLQFASALLVSSLISVSAARADNIQPPANTNSAPKVPALPSTTPISNKPAIEIPSDPIVLGARIGYSLWASKYALYRLDKEIETLSRTPKGDPTTQMITRLDRLGVATRITENSYLSQGFSALGAIGAPPTVMSEIQDVLSTLSKPLQTKSTEEASKESDPAIVRILAVIDESDRILPSSWTRARIWLKLSRGTDCAWGYDVGMLMCQLRAASSTDPLTVNIDLARMLLKNAPATASPDVKAALAELIDQEKNHKFDLLEAGVLSDKLEKTFGIQAF